MEDLSKVMLSL